MVLLLCVINISKCCIYYGSRGGSRKGGGGGGGGGANRRRGKAINDTMYGCKIHIIIIIITTNHMKAFHVILDNYLFIDARNLLAHVFGELAI